MKNRDFLRRAAEFAVGKGFYIVLFLCVATIGVSGYHLLRTVVRDTGDSAAVQGEAAVTVPDQASVRPVAPVAPPERPEAAAPTVPEPPVQPEDPEPKAQSAAAAQPQQDAPASAVFTWPVKGEILRDFSVETLSLDPTLGDWRTHGGLDIAAAPGVQVLSVSRGTVEKVYDDGLMGTTVVVDHGGGLRSWYANLAPETAVAQGDEVDIGTVLGTVGDTAIAEVGVGSHLHLEMTVDGRAVDPLEHLK